MKCALLITEDHKQICLAPESDSERAALALITPDVDISTIAKRGAIYDRATQICAGSDITMCRGGYLRAFDDGRCVNLVLTEKKPEPVEPEPAKPMDLTMIVPGAISTNFLVQTSIGVFEYSVHMDGRTFRRRTGENQMPEVELVEKPE